MIKPITTTTTPTVMPTEPRVRVGRRGLLLGLGGVAAWLARERVRSGTRLFSATVEELKQDREDLRS